jgi:hypothetical protein
MAGESKRLATLIALTTHLEEEVSLVNDYKHDLAGAVFRGRMKYDDADPLPSVSILESPNPDRFPNRAGEEDAEEIDQRDNWTLLIQGWVMDDEDHPTDPAYELMADVKKALAALIRTNRNGDGAHPNYLLGGLILGLAYESGTVRPPDELSAKAYFWMRVILKFSENVFDPYQLD